MLATNRDQMNSFHMPYNKPNRIIPINYVTTFYCLFVSVGSMYIYPKHKGNNPILKSSGILKKNLICNAAVK